MARVHYFVTATVADRANDIPKGVGTRHCITDAHGYIVGGLSDVPEPLARLICRAINDAYYQGTEEAKGAIRYALGIKEED